MLPDSTFVRLEPVFTFLILAGQKPRGMEHILQTNYPETMGHSSLVGDAAEAVRSLLAADSKTRGECCCDAAILHRSLF
jgi:hypothetical protein